ncbi:AAA family ATPase [Hazenella sp. IB182357]|uniref:DNA 5'-3' helicase n=1 Tax=Polycladospora coralii TaxID=2771432 RepID=A0A926NI78_9BACL|nr:DnaB-like helicase C-terminal domain-containing protein [Polycladospora coralii]MBD1373743.1 AAA family ATPase [Polycladospora coralii]
MIAETNMIAQDHQAKLEYEIIGCLLTDPEGVLPEVEDLLKADYFYYQAHKKIISKIIDLYRNQKVTDINPVGLLDVFTETNLTMKDCTDMINSVVTTANTRSYCEKLKNIYSWREIQQVAQQVLGERMLQDSDDIQNLINKAQDGLQRISDGQQMHNEVITMTDVLKDVTEEVLENKPLNTLKTGINKLDQFTGGFRDDELIILAGRTSMGKTAISLSMMENMIKQGKHILYFSLEMSRGSMVQRMLSAVGHINSRKWKMTDDQNKLILTDDDIYRLTAAAGELDSYPGEGFWEDQPHTVEDIRAKVRKIKRMHGLDGVIIDYISLITPTYPQHNPNEQLTHAIRTLKMIAKEMKIPVIVLAQINRGVESRQEKRPLVSDLKDSGSIEQEADIALLLYRDAYYNPPERYTPVDEIEIIVGKNRNGAVGTVKANYLKEFTKVTNKG